MKILFHFYHEKYSGSKGPGGHMYKLLKNMGITDSKQRIPYFTSSISIPDKKSNGTTQIINDRMLKNYGMFVTKNSTNMKPDRNVIQFGDSVIKTPMAIIQHAAEYMERTHTKHLKRLKLLQPQANSYSHRGIFERVNFNK